VPVLARERALLPSSPRSLLIRAPTQVVPRRTSAATGQRPSDLYDQLAGAAGPETRFCAAALFGRYFLLLGADGDVLLGGDDVAEHEQLVWDTAVACLALSVKVHVSPVCGARISC
jgi:hypothetical protein